MKNRKIFAILTLIAFMMTLLPVAAFAASDGELNRHTSSFSTDKNKVEADGSKKVELTIYVRDGDYKGQDGGVVYVASERKDADKFYAKDGEILGFYKYNKPSEKFELVETENPDDKDAAEKITGYQFIAVAANSSGKVTLEARSKIAGDAKFAVGLNNLVYEYLVDSDVTAADAEIIGSKTVTFEATDADDIIVSKVEIRRGGAETIPTDKNWVEKTQKDQDANDKGKRYYDVEKEDEDKEVKANNTDYYEVTFQLTNKVGAPVEGEKIDFSVNKSQARLSEYSVETDEIGEAEVKIYAKKSGFYELKATKGSSWAKVRVYFEPSSFDDFIVVKNLDEKIAYNENEPANFKLQLLDAQGNDYDLVYDEDAKEYDGATKLTDYVEDEKITFEWVTKPSDSDLDDDDFEEGTNGAKLENDNGLLKVVLPKLDEEGKYALKVSLESGKSHTFNFEAKEQGDIVKITLEYDEPTLVLGAKSSSPTVKKIDADGVRMDIEKGSLEWSVSDYKLLYPGWDVDENDGKLRATDDDDYTGELVVTVIDTTNDLTASTTIEIADAAAGIELTSPENLVVGEENTVKLTVKDRKGNKAALGQVKNVQFDHYVVSKPDGALVSVEEGQQFSKRLKEKGEADVKVYSDKPGKVKFTVTVSYDVDENVQKVEDDKKVTTEEKQVKKRFAKTIEVDFGEKKEVKTIGAKNVTLFINGTGYVVDGAAKVTDVAPFIQDNRTFVPVRIVAEALGCENEDTMWDPATQTVTLEREDLTITMTIGSNILTVSTGETVVSDVAPFIKDGRTVLPFRAIAEAFGADVEAIFAADGSVTGVTFEQ